MPAPHEHRCRPAQQLTARSGYGRANGRRRRRLASRWHHDDGVEPAAHWRRRSVTATGSAARGHARAGGFSGDCLPPGTRSCRGRQAAAQHQDYLQRQIATASLDLDIWLHSWAKLPSAPATRIAPPSASRELQASCPSELAWSSELPITAAAARKRPRPAGPREQFVPIPPLTGPDALLIEQGESVSRWAIESLTPSP